MNYQSHPTVNKTPSRRTRKSDRSKVFIANRSMKALEKKARRLARKSISD